MIAILSLNSGRPYNLRTNIDLNMNYSGGDWPLGTGKNTGITSGFANVDLRLQRSFTYQEKYKIETTIEVFNLFNWVNLDPDGARRTFLADKNGNFNLPPKQGKSFGLPRENYFRSFPARQIQLGIKINF